MIEATTNASAFAEALSRYIEVSKKTPEDALRQKAKQLLLGVGRDTAHQKGLFERLQDTAPAHGRVSQERKSAGYRIGKPDSTSLQWAQARANQLLGASRYGVFRIISGSAGGVEYPAKIQAGQVRTKGKRAGQLAFGRGGKLLKNGRFASLGGGGIVDESIRQQAKNLGAVALNRQALTVALAIARREKSRLSTASQFLPSRYRRVLDQDGVRQRTLIQNRKGTNLGSIDIVPAGIVSDPVITITGFRGLFTPAQQSAVGEALAVVVADMNVYIERKIRGDFQKAGVN